MADSTQQEAWDAWFDNQWDLNHCIDRAVKEQSKGRGDGFRVALYASVIEHCAEALRSYIPDASMKPETPDSAPGLGQRMAAAEEPLRRPQ